jgi:hypothetical protein
VFKRIKQDRPSEETFRWAALRIVQDRYDPITIHVPNGMYVNVYSVSEDRERDLRIIKAELEAEGLPGVYISLADYALKRLVQYKNKEV